MAIKCPHCGAFNANEATACQRCGRLLEDAAQAPASTEIDENERGRERFWRRLFPRRKDR